MTPGVVTTAMFLLTGSPLPSPHADTPTTTPEVDADLVTPGLWGFLTLFLSAVAVYFLGRSMARRVQRVNHRARLQAEAEAQSRAEAGVGARDGAGDGAGDGAEAEDEAVTVGEVPVETVGEVPVETVGEAENKADPRAAAELAAQDDHRGVPTGATSLAEEDAAAPRDDPANDHHQASRERERTAETVEPWQRP
jgi:hypothetical protein